jgi:hypothetical protein
MQRHTGRTTLGKEDKNTGMLLQHTVYWQASTISETSAKTLPITASPYLRYDRRGHAPLEEVLPAEPAEPLPGMQRTNVSTQNPNRQRKIVIKLKY